MFALFSVTRLGRHLDVKVHMNFPTENTVLLVHTYAQSVHLYVLLEMTKPARPTDGI
jgi:hypothetical protein